MLDERRAAVPVREDAVRFDDAAALDAPKRPLVDREREVAPVRPAAALPRLEAARLPAALALVRLAVLLAFVRALVRFFARDADGAEAAA